MANIVEHITQILELLLKWYQEKKISIEERKELKSRVLIRVDLREQQYSKRTFRKFLRVLGRKQAFGSFQENDEETDEIKAN